MQNLVIIGSGGHAESCLDVITSTKKFKVRGYIGSEINNNLSNQIDWLGDESAIKKLDKNRDNIVLGFANIGKKNLINKVNLFIFFKKKNLIYQL